MNALCALNIQAVADQRLGQTIGQAVAQAHDGTTVVCQSRLNLRRTIHYVVGDLCHVVTFEGVTTFHAALLRGQQRGRDLLHEHALESRGHVAAVQRLGGSRNRAALLVPQNHNQRYFQGVHREFQGGQHGQVGDLAGGADNEDIAEALVEEDLHRRAGIGTRQHHGLGFLPLLQGNPAAQILVWVVGIAAHETLVAFAQAIPSLLRGLMLAGSHGSIVHRATVIRAMNSPSATSPNPPAAPHSSLPTKLNSWYALNARDLPWRHPDTTPWAILLSEVMSQQTPVARVVPLWRAWLKRWPTPADLAEAPRSEILKMWANLGYPRRALRLKECAIACVERHGGEVPSDIAELEALPGIGHYTARAVAAFAFGQAVPVVDTNVRRVYRRLVDGRYLQGPARARDLADVASLLPHVDPDPRLVGRQLSQSPRPQPTDADSGTGTGTGDSSAGARTDTAKDADRDAANLMCAALMELGALICTAKSPECEQCPVIDNCAWVQAGKPLPTEAEARAAAQRVQKFAGTDRQVRGKIMGLLREAGEGGVTKKEIDLLWPATEQLERALQSLLDDGLLTSDGATYQLPH